MADRRALLIGVETYLDDALVGRPGTTVYLERIARRLALGQWQVTLFSSAAGDESKRPLLSNVLDQLDGLAQADEVLVIFAGIVRDDRLFLRDARTSQLQRTTLTLAELVAALPAPSGVLVDGPVLPGALEGVTWASAWTEDAVVKAAEPSPFLAAIAHGLGTESVANPITCARLMTLVGDTLHQMDDAPRLWRTGQPTKTVLVSAPPAQVTCGHCLKVVEQVAASFCPHCGRSMASSGSIGDGRYELLDTLGHGGMGHVYLAKDTRLGCERALKLLSLPDTLDAHNAEILRARLIQEARAAQTLGDKTHHVVRVFDVGHSAERGVPFLVMEVLRGETLQDRIAQGPLPVSKAVSITHQIATTLAVAHPSGMIHRDLKPSNVMLVERDGVPDFVKLLDFGLVKVENAELLTESGTAMGTLQYMPPEQLQGQVVDARADVFALGAVLYECLTGVRANPGRAQHEIFRVLLDVGVTPIARVNPDLPDGLCAVVDRCLQLDPAARYADGGAVVDALSPFLGGEDTPFIEPSMPMTGTGDASQAPTEPGWVEADELPAVSTPSLATGEIAIDETRRETARWPILVAAALVVGVGLAWGLSGNAPAGVSDATTAMTTPTVLPPASPSAPTAVRAPDAAPPPASDPGPEPLKRPQGPLPGDIEVLRRIEGDGVFYQTPDRLHAFAAIVRDVTVGTQIPPVPDPVADEQWRGAPDAVRTWLGQAIDLDGIEAHATGLRLARRHLDGLRAVRPQVVKIRRLGHLWTDATRRPIFSTVNCRGAKPGDRLVTAKWAVLGYSGGRCRDHGCPKALARALQNVRQLGEQLRLSLELERSSETGDESSTTHARCVLR